MKRQSPKTPEFSKATCALSVVLIVVTAYASSGCKSPLYTPAKARTQEEAASTHLAVLSVARWDARKVELQPNFDLKADDALAKVLPNTLGSEEKLVDALAPTAKVLLAVDKADVRGILPADKVKQSGAGWELSTNGTYTIQMGNLNSLEAVQLSARDGASKAGPSVRTVRVQFNDK
jgi:hypothetical protein